MASLFALRDVLIDQFIASFDTPPARLTFDIDTYDDPAHGEQQLVLFHKHYNQYQYQPRVINLLVRLRRAVAAPPPAVGADVPPQALGGRDRQRYAARRQHDPLGEGHPCTWRSRLIKVAAEIIVTNTPHSGEAVRLLALSRLLPPRVPGSRSVRSAPSRSGLTAPTTRHGPPQRPRPGRDGNAENAQRPADDSLGASVRSALSRPVWRKRTECVP